MIEWELLISTSNEVELGIITTILENNQVVFITKDAASIGGYMRIYSGHSIYGTEIYVEKHELEHASDLISNFLSDMDSEENGGNEP